MTQYILWVDLETTGLDPRNGSVLEVAAFLTDETLNVIDYRVRQISFNDEIARLAVDPFVLDMHTKNGLWDKCRASHFTIDDADGFVMEMLHPIPFSDDTPVVPRGEALLGGSTVNFDRAWMEVHMPRTFAHLSYRNIDVSTIKRCAALWMPNIGNPPESSGQHRARADIMETLDQMRFFKDRIFTPKEEQ